MLAVCLAMLESDAQRACFLKLHDNYEGLLYKIALSMLRDPALAEDALQESWMRVASSFEKISQISGDTIGGYLVIVVKNVCRNMLRKARRDSEFPEGWDAPAQQRADAPTIARMVELIRALPEGYREILELKFVLEYNNREIAQRLGIHASTVSSRVARGREFLIQALREEGYEP